MVSGFALPHLDGLGVVPEVQATPAAQYTESLNDAQSRAVLSNAEALLIVAGAGSGKTRVLTHRIARLLGEGHVRPGGVLAITFTNKAAAEMRERVEAMIGPAARSMWLATFHSACTRMLRYESSTVGLPSNFSIYDTADQVRMMTLVAKELGFDPRSRSPKSMLYKISSLKNELIDAESFASTIDSSDPGQVALAQAYSLYSQRMRAAGALDFDDIIMTCVHMLQAFPAIAEHYRRRFQHVFVDEYQDTNHAQYVLIRELVGGDRSAPGMAPTGLTVVGDSDQSIYAFRGATIRNIEEFEEDFPRAETITLEQNYRSTQNILSAANSIIAGNEGRRAKNLWTDAGAGDKIIGFMAADEHAEAQFVADEIDRLGDEQSVKPGDVAVFYRTNAQSRALEEVFMRTGMPYKVVGGTRFYERREIKDAIAYLRAVANPADVVSVRRILNVPKRGIGDKAETYVEAFAAQQNCTFSEALGRASEIGGLAKRSASAISSFVELLGSVRAQAEETGSVREVLSELLERSGYVKTLQSSSDPQDESRLDNLAELLSVAGEFDAEYPGANIADFLERVSLVADADSVPEASDEDQGVVTMMTLHTAKGLEFPTVFLTGLEDGVFPHMRALGNDAELAEERRLAYVGFTRARERLFVSLAAARSAFGQAAYNPPSRFLSAVPDDVLQWHEGTQSPSFGSMVGGRRGSQSGAWKQSGHSSAHSGHNTANSGRKKADSGRGSAHSGGSSMGSPIRPRRAQSVDVSEFSVGDRVTHDTFGLGTVTALEGQGDKTQIHVDFGSEGTKRLLLRYAPVEKL